MSHSAMLLCLASAASFGAMGIFGKLAYADGATVATLLSVRFVLAAALLWLLVAFTGNGRRRLVSMSRTDLGIALALGAVGYSAQAGAYFGGLQRLDASLLAMLVYTFPAMVTVAAIALGRERASGRTAGALILASGGLVLVFAGAAAGALDPLGTLLGLTAAGVYATYVLASEGISARVDPLVLSALVCTGAAATVTVAGVATGELAPAAVSPAGLGWLAALALVSTVAAVTLFFAGLRRVGPAAAAILSCLEPVVAVGLALAVFGEALGPVQVAGGALVLAAVVVLAGSRMSAVTVRAAIGPHEAACRGAGAGV
ncbi:MAG TPA: EamA family transporter [Solirubrobacteraceae bacterium]|nr:EamA family transporter [Solirubrobacteraceae bacterium]